MRHPARVTVVEVGPRDGLQNEDASVSTADKVGFVDRLSAAGLPVIEVAAFVSPKWIPQMADAREVFAGIRRQPGVRYTALVPNVAGLERAMAAGVREIAIFAAASETFSQRNINQSIARSLEVYGDVCTRAAAAGLRVRAYLSTAFGCPYEGAVPAVRVAELSAALVAMGAFEVAVSDTIGIANPGQVVEVVGAVGARVPLDRLALHFHDTRGVGGCPYAPGAAGNLATEDLIFMLDGLGITTGVHLDAIVEASTFIEARVGHALPSRYAQAARASARTSKPSPPTGERRSSS